MINVTTGIRAEEVRLQGQHVLFVEGRDHHKHDFVEGCWKNFPDPDTDHLLVWRCREIENYFLASWTFLPE